MLEIAQRHNLARELCQHYATRHPTIVLAGGRFERDMTDFDPLDLWVIVEGPSDLADHALLFQETVVRISVSERAELEAGLRGESLAWPKYVEQLSQLQVVIGSVEQQQTWQDLGKSAPLERLRATLEQQLASLVMARYGELRASAARNQPHRARQATVALLAELHTALCMLNGKVWPADQIPTAPVKLPNGYSALLAATQASHDLSELVTVCGTLVSGYWRLLAKEGLNLINHQKVNA